MARITSIEKRTWIYLLLVVACASIINVANGQDTLLKVPSNVKLDSLNSAILQQKRMIQVFTPVDYKPGSQVKYDVLYFLDGGNWNGSVITQLQRFIEGEGQMPPTIIVSIMGIDRNVELTPTHLESWKGSGGGAKFLGFIKNELIPYINKTYPSNGDNTLWGHSLGGMFVMYALLNEPSLFKSFIAIDPSIWWDNNLVAKMAESKLPHLGSDEKTLFIAGREGPDFDDMKIDTMEYVLKKAAPANLRWKVTAYADETHASVRLKGTYDGLKFTYAGLSGNLEFHPMNGVILKDKPITIWFFDDTANVYYTLDGTVPTASSAKVQKNNTLTIPAKITYKRLTNRSLYDKTATGEFHTEKMLVPVAKKKNFRSGGFSYAYYEENLEKWPDLKAMKPVKTGITGKGFDMDSLPRKNNFGLVADGYLEIKEDGYYIFLFQADKNSKLYLGKKLLIESNGNPNQKNSSYILPLTKGIYPLRIEYLHNNEDFKFWLAYLTPSILDTKEPVPIPLDLQYHLE